MKAVYGSVPFAEQISFFRNKLSIPTNAWTDIYSREHDWAFMVAGANRDDLLADFRHAVDLAISQGITLEDFRKDFDRIVQRYGWDYNGGRNWRSRVIYETNLFSSYQAGRMQQLNGHTEAMPYWQYHHSDAVERPREEHLAWDGMILRHDDPFWKTHYPPNGWGCQCTVTALSEFDLQRMGRQVDRSPPVDWEERVIGQHSPDGPRTVRVPKGIDPGFEHAPGQSRLQSAIPPEKPMPPLRGNEGVPNKGASDPLPPPRKVDASLLLPEGLSEQDYVNAFLKQFGAEYGGEPVVFRDVTGSAVTVGDSLFQRRGKSSGSKINKRGRGKYMAIFAQAIINPDEIWARLEYQHAQQKPVVRRRYIAQYELPGEALPVLAVWEQGKDGWSGITVHNIELYDIDQARVGVRLYQRKE